MFLMKPEERIGKDLKILEENVKQLDDVLLTDEQKLVEDMAERYYEDTKYYLKIGDSLTSFACIAYAHGLLDSLRIMHNLIQDDV